MRNRMLIAGCFVAATLLVVGITAVGLATQVDLQWKIHDTSRPRPPIITPGTASTQDYPGRPPSDAIVLFGGKYLDSKPRDPLGIMSEPIVLRNDLSHWQTSTGEPAKWKVENGYFEVVPKAGTIQTRQGFGDCQLHVEWAAPDPPRGQDQDRGNSGVYLMGLYEVQVLDSFNNTTYADGQAGAVYGQYPPLVNAARPPGQWQTYDIIFHGPRFDREGKVLRPARVTVLHNGVLVQDNVELTGPTSHKERPPYRAHPEKLPLMLQDHDHPVRFRNIWIRELGGNGK